jgi:hypothetical protein
MPVHAKSADDYLLFINVDVTIKIKSGTMLQRLRILTAFKLI